MRSTGATALLVCLLGGLAQAAPIGPDAFGYTAVGITAPFKDIAGAGTEILNYSDDDTLEIDLGFAFSFYGATYTTACVGANGVLGFGGCEPSHNPVDLSTTPTFNDVAMAAVLWDDWQFYDPGTGSVWYQIMGAPGSQSLIVQWNQADAWPLSRTPVTFSATLFEGTNKIWFQYLAVDTGDDHAFGGLASVGIRDVGGDLSGRALSWSYQSGKIEGASGIEFSSAVSEVPEPATTGLTGAGLGLLVAAAARRRSGKR